MGLNLITFDNDSKSYVSEEIFKHLETGYIKHSYRASSQFIVRERVLHGFKYAFLDGVDLFTIDGRFIGKIYRIRDNKYYQFASQELIKKLMINYLYSDNNRNKHLYLQLADLYSSDENLTYQTIIKNFIEKHEK